MSHSNDLNIDHVANLARLALTAEEKAQYATQLTEILSHIAKLKEVNVEGVEPTAHAFPLYNVWAEDVPVAGLPADLALRNARLNAIRCSRYPKWWSEMTWSVGLVARGPRSPDETDPN
jgi:aspartyl-tRNA(Asn)/glutamyl-tRNA(Gln) amidotransferase subunit C